MSRAKSWIPTTPYFIICQILKNSNLFGTIKVSTDPKKGGKRENKKKRQKKKKKLLPNLRNGKDYKYNSLLSWNLVSPFNKWIEVYSHTEPVRHACNLHTEKHQTIIELNLIFPQPRRLENGADKFYISNIKHKSNTKSWYVRAKQSKIQVSVNPHVGVWVWRTPNLGI